MIISHKFKFIFIKTRKTAGTSIEADLSGLIGEEDVVTRIFPEEAVHKPRNYIIGSIEMYNHISALEVRQVIGHEMFSKYFKFCVEREPVDKCISHFSMLKNSPLHNKNYSDLTWDKYMESEKFPVDEDKYCDKDGTLLVDRIINYENLNNELSSVMQYLEVPFPGLKSRLKAGFRSASIRSTDIPLSQKRIIYSFFSNSMKFSRYSLSA